MLMARRGWKPYLLGRVNQIDFALLGFRFEHLAFAERLNSRAGEYSI